MHRLFSVLNALSVVVVFFAAAMLAPLGVSLLYGDTATRAFVHGVLITAISGIFLWLGTRRNRAELQPRDAFLLVALVWTMLPAFATLPLIFYFPAMNFSGAYFETVA